MLLGAVVILYNPEVSTVIKNILTYLPFVDRLYIIDNSETKNFEISLLGEFQSKTEYIFNNQNEGISQPLNKALNLATAEGLDYLLTMDQDSAFSENDFQKYLNRILTNTEENVAIYSINFQPNIYSETDPSFFVESTITSGAVMYLPFCNEVGKFNEDLFIDLVDLEFCFRVNRMGYKILLFPDIVLDHHLGYTVEARSLLTFKKSRRILHAPIRLYYILRNSLYLLKNYHLSKAEKAEVKNCLALLKNNLLYHDQRWKVIKYLSKAYSDYKYNRMGKIKM